MRRPFTERGKRAGNATWLAALFAGALLAAGCTGAPATPSPSSPSNSIGPAPGSASDASAGSIVGVVVNEEELPVKGATVALVDNNQQLETGDDGAFTFAGLQPGGYRIVAQALGFEEQARRVDVLGGETTSVRFVLVAISVLEEAYFDAQPRTAFIDVDQGLVGGTLRFVAGMNLTPIDVFCRSCKHTYRLGPPRPVETLSEANWAPSGNPVTNQRIEFWYWLDGTYLGGGTYELAILQSRGAKVWSEKAITFLKTKKTEEIRLDIIADELGLSFQHRVDVWTTFAYNGPLADGYTALPPP